MMWLRVMGKKVGSVSMGSGSGSGIRARHCHNPLNRNITLEGAS